ncbi:transcriptional regulator TbsP domain-containing protein [Halorubrum ezzemoulense]|uniref:transcriptional regulator TbsP domain-containing protein n=1 Tax=Halorubrum ezzemoulense TaxID=337243 RepID=UPI003D7DDD05
MGADDAEPEADAAAGSDGSGPSRTPEDAGSDGSASAGAPAAADPDCVGDATEVADALPRPDDPLTESVEAALAGRSGVVAVGVPLRLLPAVLAARERSPGPLWRVACRPGVVDALARAPVLGTAVAEAVERDEIRVRTGDPLGHGTGGTLFATPERADAVVGPRGDRSLATTAAGARPEAVGTARATAAARFDAATVEPVEMPSRRRLLAVAREILDDRFADDLATVLESLPPGEFGRATEPSDRSLLVALAARHDHLFRDLRAWAGADGIGIAPAQEFTGDRQALVERELIESIKVPAGPGRPMLRLRAVDDALLRARAEEVPSVLEGRFDLPTDADGRTRHDAGRGERRPVWERKRR